LLGKSRLLPLKDVMAAIVIGRQVSAELQAPGKGFVIDRDWASLTCGK
jgi:hypothetical protein